MENIPEYSTVRLKKIGNFTIADKEAVCNPKTAIKIFREALQDADREKLYCAFLTVAHKIISVSCMFQGTIDRAAIYPREIFKMAILLNAVAIILCHNHPSGECGPSTDDDKMTKEIRAGGEIMGISLMDHIIIGDDPDKYYSYAEDGKL